MKKKITILAIFTLFIIATIAVAQKISTLPLQTTLNDADYIPIIEASGPTTNRTTFTTIKSFLKTYFDTLYVSYTAASDVDLNDNGLQGLKYTEYSSLSNVTAAASAATLPFSTYDFVKLSLNDQASVTITLTEPGSSIFRARKTVNIIQGSTTATTTITWSTSGSATFHWAGGETTWSTTLDDEFWVTFVWDGVSSRWIGFGSEALQ